MNDWGVWLWIAESVLASSVLLLSLEESGFCCQTLEHGFELRSITVVTGEFPSAMSNPDQLTRTDAKLTAT